MRSTRPVQPEPPPSGCHFRPRCPHATEICRRIYPAWVQVTPDRGVACHLYPPDAGAAAS